MLQTAVICNKFQTYNKLCPFSKHNFNNKAITSYFNGINAINVFHTGKYALSTGLSFLRAFDIYVIIASDNTFYTITLKTKIK